jgi:hypothetical protein
MRRVLGLAAAACISSCGGEKPAPVAPEPPASAPASAAVPPRPVEPSREPVVVAIVVDQLAAWIAETRLPELPPGRGLTRLVREGTWAKHMVYSYAVTDTAPGHAALHTGKPPSETGMFANEVPDPALGRRVSILRDPSTRLVTADGTKDVPGASAARLRVETVADRLRAARPDALVVSVSLKDRGAIIPGGKKPSHAIWFDTSEGAFVTSTAFEGTLPAWAARVGDARTIAAMRSLPWEPLDPEWLAKHAGVPDDAPGEGDLDGLGTTFPHRAKSGAAFRALPASDQAIVRLALAGVLAEYDPKRPTLVLLSFSASDVIGHTFGPDSWEAWDQLRRLDGTIGELIDTLTAHVGPIAVMLSADHGSIPMPETAKARADRCADCTTGERIAPVALGAELRAALKQALGAGDFVEGVADPYVYLSRAARTLPPAKRAALDRAVRATLAKHKGVAKVYDAKTLAASCPAALAKGGDDMLALVCRSWPGPPAESGAGDYYVVTAPGSFFDAEITTGKGTSHGTPYLYDRTVPLLVRAPGVDAGEVVDEPIDFAAYSAIEASLLGLDPRTPKAILEASRLRR